MGFGAGMDDAERRVVAADRAAERARRVKPTRVVDGVLGARPAAAELDDGDADGAGVDGADDAGAAPAVTGRTTGAALRCARRPSR